MAAGSRVPRGAAVSETVTTVEPLPVPRDSSAKLRLSEQCTETAVCPTARALKVMVVDKEDNPSLPPTSAKFPSEVLAPPVYWSI